MEPVEQEREPVSTTRSGSGRLVRAAVELVVIFVGVTAAFLVDEYRDQRQDEEALREITAGLIEELGHYGGLEPGSDLAFPDSITTRFEAWRAADRAGERTVPEFYRIPGAPYPPTAAWDAAVSSGLTSLFNPSLRFDIGFFYSEFVGVHANYQRHVRFIEQEIMPRALLGPDALYDARGRLLPEVRVHMHLMEEFARDLRALSATARELRARLLEMEFPVE